MPHSARDASGSALRAHAERQPEPVPRRAQRRLPPAVGVDHVASVLRVVLAAALVERAASVHRGGHSSGASTQLGLAAAAGVIWLAESASSGCGGSCPIEP